MNVNQIVNMVVRMVMRTVMQKGMSAGINKFANRKGKSGQDGSGDAQAKSSKAESGKNSDYNDPGMNKRTRQSLRIGRRMGKF
ncbi:MAG: hypothetical protein FH759_06490 [Sediminimonas qiaohouensis]|uniref:Uncharacterized protein n=1 Tax=Sediminimonas qiaohouensis TaxID=552061 RepID=A0A7C9HBV7_9RHOB|nr:hypothetical protein [Sediminimonas qiaohouensis]MTJ04327.1 hypothetical protein [Sediminimonas qiaohouensis]